MDQINYTSTPDSSHIAGIAHDGKNTLFIKFNTGKEYSYKPVTHEYYLSLLKAESVGKAFYKDIKTNPDLEVTKLGEDGDN